MITLEEAHAKAKEQKLLDGILKLWQNKTRINGGTGILRV
jgi:hypothetical protein